MNQNKYHEIPFSLKLARFSLLLHNAYPFLGELCMRVEKYRKEQDALAATDGFRLYLNTQRLNKLPEECLNFILIHELLHIILRHRYPKNVQYFEKIYWNIGCDLVVNFILMSMSNELKSKGLPVIPIADSLLTSDDLSGDPSNVIIDSFIKQAVSQGIISDNPPLIVDLEWKSFKISVSYTSLFIFDLIDKIEADGDYSDGDVQELFSSCFKLAGKHGLPWQLRNLWNEINGGRKLPWYLILKKYLEEMIDENDFDFCPPDKRTVYRELILPAETVDEKNEIKNALIVVDVSSSIYKSELLLNIWHINSILNELNIKGKIISFGSHIYKESTLSNKASLKKFIDDLDVGGGTNWESVIQYVNSNKVLLKPIIVFTDGYFYTFNKELSDVIFITQEDYPGYLNDLGRVIKINK